MKTRYVICIILTVLLLMLAGCGGGTSGEATSTEPTTEPTTETTGGTATKTYNILFIGNSYSHTYDLPTEYFEKIAEAGGIDVDTDIVTHGGYKLDQFADPTDTYGKQVEEALTGTKKYDYVILQETSVRPAKEPELFYSAVRNLVARVREHGATPILYSTWGRKTGSETLDKYGWTNESMTWMTAAAYEAIGQELGVQVAHVGLAFFDVYTNSNYNPYQTDMSHPSRRGCYIAATTLFVKIFQVEPPTYLITDVVSSACAKVLREAVRKAVYETPEIPEEYRTTSQGIG